MKRSSLLATAIGLTIPLGLSLPSAMAADFTFGGSGNWYTAGNPNWTPDPALTGAFNNGFFDTAGRNAVVNGTAVYNAGNDFQLGQGNTMTIDGGSWTQQAATGNWIKIGGTGTGGTGTVVLRNGGSLSNQGGVLRLGIDGTGATGVVTVESTAGSLNSIETTIGATSSMSIAGGTNTLSTTSHDFGVIGALTVTGGATSATNVVNTASTTAVNVSGGSLTFTGNAVGAGNVFFNSAATVHITGGSVAMTGTGEFQPGGTGNAAAGTGLQGISGTASLSIAGLVAFQGPNTTFFNISNAATITIGSSFQDGIFSAGGFFNFTSINTGSSILFTGTGAGENNIFEGQIRYLGGTFSAGDYTTRFLVTHPTLGQTLITAIPEPSSYAIAIGLGCFGLIYLRRRKLGLGS